MNNLGSYYNEHGLRRSSRVNKLEDKKSASVKSSNTPQDKKSATAKTPQHKKSATAKTPQHKKSATAKTPQDKKSATVSPIYKRNPSMSIQDRLNKYKGLQKIKDIKYYLNINKLLAKIEDKATGIVCLSNNSELILEDKTLNNFRFAIKIAENISNDSVKEIYILEKMMHFIKNGYHNLPLIYCSFMKMKTHDIIKNMNIDSENFSKIKGFFRDSKNYNVYVNELANGDLKSFLNLYDTVDGEITEEIILNAVSQILMSIATLHSIGIRHNDTHFGNFLYHKIKPGGYIKYTVNNETYYIKNLGYLWVIWDFGISIQIYNPEMDYMYDYEMLSLFLRKDEGKYNMHFKANNNNNQLVRRKHGYLKFENKEIPAELTKITDLIYRFSVNGINPDVPMDYGNMLLLTKITDLSPEKRKELMDLSTPNYKLYDKQKNPIDEASFLTKYIIPLLPSAIEKGDVGKNDVIFDISLDFEQIDFVRTLDKNGRNVVNYKESMKKYDGRKIILMS
jgi:hypothetical protein